MILVLIWIHYSNQCFQIVLLLRASSLVEIKLGTWQTMAFYPSLRVYWLIPLTKLPVVSFDESLNDVLQSCEMELLLRYFDSDNFTVKICYYNSRFFGHTTHRDLLKQVNDRMKQLDVNKLLQLSVDGLSVSHEFLEEVSKERKGDEQYQLINIGGLHAIHDDFKTGAENAECNIKETLKGAFQVFHNSPARRDDFESMTGMKVYPLLFCTTR